MAVAVASGDLLRPKWGTRVNSSLSNLKSAKMSSTGPVEVFSYSCVTLSYSVAVKDPMIAFCAFVNLVLDRDCLKPCARCLKYFL